MGTDFSSDRLLILDTIFAVDMLSATKRLAKELPKVTSILPYFRDNLDVFSELTSHHIQVHGALPDGIILVSAEGFEEWFMDIQVLDGNPLYVGQTFRLKFKFNSSYPIGILPLSLDCTMFD